MKRFLICFSVFLTVLCTEFTVGAFNCEGTLPQTDQKDQALSLLSDAVNSRVSFDFECTVNLEKPTKCSGNAVLMGTCFVVKTALYNIYCDGSRIVFLDHYQHEAYIESVSSLQSYLENNASSVSDLSFKNMKKSSKTSSLKSFSFDTSSLDDSWTVTDLR